jgi:putative endonuclease
MKRGGFIYILTNSRNTTLYTGVTSDLHTRIHQHQTGQYPNSFTKRYNISKLVYYEYFNSIEEAIAREKQIKAGSRKKKEELIKSMNPIWNDLFDRLEV